MTNDQFTPAAPPARKRRSAEPLPEAARAAGPDTRGPRAQLLFSQSERFALVLLLFGAVAFFSLLPKTSGTFLTDANFVTVVSTETLPCFLAFALIVPLLAGAFDLSVGANLGLTAIAAATVMSRFHQSPAVAVLAALAVGLLVGLVNGVFAALLRLNSLIVTLAVATVIGGLVEWYTGGAPIDTGISPAIVSFGNAQWLGIPRSAYLLILVVAAVWYLLEHTPFGKYLHAIGSNRRAAHLVGIRVELMTFWSYLISGLLAGVGGVVATANLGGANPTTGPDLLFPALAAVFLGSTCIRPGVFNILGTFVAVFFIAVCDSGLSLMGVATWASPVFDGGALVIAVLVSSYLSRRKRAGVD